MLVVAVVPDRNAEVLALGFVHRDIGAAQERRTLAAMFGECSHTHARPDIDHVPIEGHRRLENLQDFLRDVLGIGRGRARQKDRELVATQSRDRLSGTPDDPLQARGDFA